jgi:hypothetical protein
MRPCVLCGSVAGRGTDEHVIPKWARDAFDIQGWVTIGAGSSDGAALEQAGRLQHLNIVLKAGLCQPCNNEWLAPVERRVQAILLPMALRTEASVILDAAGQALLAFWAVKTVLLLELAIRQKFPGRRAIEGYVATGPELAWLRERAEPPPRAMVWLGCWDCEREVPVNYEPSGAELPTRDRTELGGHLATFTLGYAVFQVFTVDFVAAELHGAPVWNRRPPPPLSDALPRIWPPQLVVPDVTWPPPAFPRGDWHRMVTWDGVLRPGEIARSPTAG